MKYTVERIERFKWPVSVSRKIDSSPEQIWSVIAKPGNLKDFHPYCKKNTVYAWPGIGSKDRIDYYSGWVLHREFITWLDGVGYDLVIGREGGKMSYVSWRIDREQDGSGTLRITIYPYTFQNIPAAIRWIPYLFILQPALHSYLDAVLKGFEWFITNEKPVYKDQFGSHKWFS